MRQKDKSSYKPFIYAIPGILRAFGVCHMHLSSLIARLNLCKQKQLSMHQVVKCKPLRMVSPLRDLRL